MTTATRPLPDHGTRACYLRGCDRDECERAHRRYCKAYQLRVITSGGTIRVPADDAARQVRTWHNQGYSERQIAAAAGCSGRVIHNLLTGARRLHPDIARHILAARIETAGEPAHTYVPAIGTIRRLQALAVHGWPLSTVATHVGIRARTASRILQQDVVTIGTATAVASTYAVLVGKDPEEHIAAAGVITKTRRWAAAHGWRDPLFWEDWETRLDDPEFNPAAADDGADLDPVAIERAIDPDVPCPPLTAAERKAAARILIARGMPQARAAKRVGVAERTVSRWATDWRQQREAA